MADSYVCSGAMMRCTMGTNPAMLKVLPIRTVNLTGPPMANISDHVQMLNIPPFGLCRSMAYPPTAAAHGSPTPCMPNTPKPWDNGKTDYLIKGQPALLKSCQCQCKWGGMISLITDGQVGEGTQYVKKAPIIPPEKQEKIDKIVLWDAYWEKELEKDGKPQGFETKLRFIPQQEKVGLTLVFYFKHDEANYNREKASFTLKFDIPGTLYEPKEYKLNGSDILGKEEGEIELNGRSHKLYKYSIKNFSSDLTEAVFP